MCGRRDERSHHGQGRPVGRWQLRRGPCTGVDSAMDRKDPMDPEWDHQAGVWPAEHEVRAGGTVGAVGAAVAWMECLRTDRLADVWIRMDVPFRLFLSRHWCWQQRFALSDVGYEAFDLATRLAEDGPAHRVWAAFARGHAPEVRLEHRLPRGWVPAAPPEPVGPDLELV